MLRPIVKPFVIWSRPSDDVGVFQGGGLTVFVRGADSVAATDALVPHLTGVTIAEAADRAGLDVEDTESLVAALFKRNVLDDLESDEIAEETALSAALRAFTHTPHRAAARLAGATITVLGEGKAATLVQALLQESGVGRVRAGTIDRAINPVIDPESACVVYAEDAPSADGVFEAQRLAAGSPFVPVRLDASTAWIGPTVMSGHACCWCLETRAQNMATIPGLAAARRLALANRSARGSALPALAHAAAAHVVLEAVLVASRCRAPLLLDSVMVIGVTHRCHPVLPVPGCPGCKELA